MSNIPPLSSKSFSLTRSLPVVKGLFEPTRSKVEKVAIALFTILTVLPLLVATITLLLDSLICLFNCIYPNLKTVSSEENSIPNSIPVEPANSERVPPRLPLQAPAEQVERPLQQIIPIAVQQRIVPASNQALVSPHSVAGIQESLYPMIRELMQPEHAHGQRYVLNDGNRAWNLEGHQVARLLFNLSEAIPEIAALPFDARENFQFRARVNNEEISVRGREIPIYLEALRALLAPTITSAERPMLMPAVQEIRFSERAASSSVFSNLVHAEPHSFRSSGIMIPRLEQRGLRTLPPSQTSPVPLAPASSSPVLPSIAAARAPVSTSHIPFTSASSSVVSIPPELFTEISSESVEEISTFQKTELQARWAIMQGWIFDPGNMDKGKKYSYALHATKQSLQAEFPHWKKLIPKLAAKSQNSPFAMQVYEILLILKNLDSSNAPIRLQYSSFVRNLRSALNFEVPLDAPEMQEARQILLRLCHFKFTRVNMYPFFEDFLSKALRAAQHPQDGYQIPKFTLETLAHSIEEANTRLASVPTEYTQTRAAKEFKKLQGTLGFGFDPTADSNTPWVHSIQTVKTANGSKIRLVLRHGTPTSDSNFGGAILREATNFVRSIPLLGSYIPAPEFATVIPEFKAHLQADPRKITLYVNKQQHDEKGELTVHGEIDRSRAIQSLEEFPNFHFLALPLDGPLWKKTYLNKTSTDAFKHALFTSLALQKNGFCLPRIFGDFSERHGQKVGILLDNVHKFYFGSQELVTVDQKKTFMMLFYSELKEYVCDALNVDFLVSACKDNKDRGNASTTVDMMKNLVKLGREKSPEALREVFFSVLGPFIIKNEQIIPERLELALLVINHFTQMSEAQKQAIRENFPMPLDQVVPKEKTSWAQMMGRVPFIETVEGMKARKEKRIQHVSNLDQGVAGSFKEGDIWRLDRLEQQLRRDIPCIDLQLNGQRITQFETLCQVLGLQELFTQNRQPSGEESYAIRFMALLQQGTVFDGIKDIYAQLNGNAAGLEVTLPTQPVGPVVHYPTSINARFEGNTRSIVVKQNMSLKDSADESEKYQMLAKIHVDRNFNAMLAWHFVG